jgi:MFS family permease
MLGDGLAAPAIPLLVLDRTRNPLLSALSAASVTVGYLLVGLPAGVLVDRLDPWRVLIAMDAARTLLFAALYALSVAGPLRVWLVLTLALSAGACAVFFESALTVVVKHLFAASGLMAANSAIELASPLSLIAGPAIVGLARRGGRDQPGAAGQRADFRCLTGLIGHSHLPESGLPGVPPGRARGPALARIRG